MRPATCEHPDGCAGPVAGHLDDITDPDEPPIYLCAPHIETVPAGRPVHVRLVKYRPSRTSS